DTGQARPDDQQVQRVSGRCARAVRTLGGIDHDRYGIRRRHRRLAGMRQQVARSRQVPQGGPMAFLRSAGLRGVRQVLTELGGDPDDLARRSGLPAGALDSDEILVEDLSIALLLETAAAELRCPDLGLRVAGHQDLDMLGPVAVAVKNARTTTQALEVTS